jgi:hypothetical protein
MTKEKFKIQGVGIDTSNISYNPSFSTGKFDYIYTSMTANNEGLIKDWVGEMRPTPPLIVYSDFIDSLGPALKEHLDMMGRAKTQLLLLNAEKVIGAKKEWIDDLNLGPIDNLGIQCPKDVEELKEASEVLGGMVKYVALPVSPLDFQYDVLTYCKENEITVIGLNPLGGELSAPRNIRSFSLPYLLSFCAFHTDIVMTSGKDVIKAEEDYDFLTSLVGLECGKEYDLKKNISKPVKEIKKAVWTSLDMEDGDVIPYDDPSLLVDSAKFKFGSALKTLKEKDAYEDGTFLGKLTHYLEVLHYPEDGGIQGKFTLARHKLLESIKEDYPGWNVTEIKAGSEILMVTITKDPEIKGHFIWSRLVMTDPITFCLMIVDGQPQVKICA